MRIDSRLKKLEGVLRTDKAPPCCRFMTHARMENLIHPDGATCLRHGGELCSEAQEHLRLVTQRRAQQEADMSSLPEDMGVGPFNERPRDLSAFLSDPDDLPGLDSALTR